MQLVTLTLDVKSDELDFEDQELFDSMPNEYSFPNLRKLTLTRVQLSTLSILTFFRTSSLLEMDIDFDWGGLFRYRNGEGVPRLAQTPILLDGSEQPPLKPILQDLPSLTHLTLDNVAFGDEERGFGAKPLTEDGIHVPFLPDLQTLELLDIPTDYSELLDPWQICAFITSRRPYRAGGDVVVEGADTLKSLTMSYGAPPKFFQLQDGFDALQNRH
ncbi:hypothetical protein EST38_g14469 [Candolleomyces aberdarensis]|uniref:Uncharacterized protein n=1 Tax=Candolleomyces aberdarensis TaxID=2316362 RepID=A0A4Q2CX70_9AGAR|nr:hypothetical protein EST38_g14469 [Candolleomyces aberdarensis]